MGNKDESAFPVLKYTEIPGGGARLNKVGGITKREYFAAAALTGLIANKARPHNFDPDGDADWCIAIADILLSKLENPE